MALNNALTNEIEFYKKEINRAYINNFLIDNKIVRKYILLIKLRKKVMGYDDY